MIFRALLVGAIIFGSAGLADAQLVDFRFNPPSGTVFVERLTHLRIRDLGGEEGDPRRRMEDVTESKTQYEITETEAGYMVTATPLMVANRRDGKPFPNPLMTAMAEIPIKLYLDKTGKALRATGFESVQEKIADHFPESTAQSVLRLVNPTSLSRKAVAEWNGRIGDFAGIKKEVGDAWAWTEGVPLPTGATAPMDAAVKIEERLQRGPRVLVRLRFSYDSDAEALSEFVGATVEELGLKPKQPGTQELVVKGAGERLIDPSTLLIYSETSERRMEMDMRVGREQVKGVVYEKKDYAYEFVKP